MVLTTNLIYQTPELLSKPYYINCDKGAKLVRREYPTAIGPVDIMAIDGNGEHVAIEIKRNGGIDGVEQLTPLL